MLSTFSFTSKVRWLKASYAGQIYPKAHYATESASYCAEFVKKHDYDSWLIVPFYPKDLREGYLALKAFSIELATIQDHVSNPTLGSMRLKFWKDSFTQGDQGRPPQHPIAISLHQLRQRVHLPIYHFNRIIDAREAELRSTNYPTVESLTAHAEATSSTLLYLLLSLLSLSSATLSHAASHLGIAQTLSILLRAFPFHSRNRRMVIPTEITSKHGLVHEEVFRKGPQAEGVDSAIFELATIANDHLLTSRSMFQDGKVPPGAVPIFMAGVPVARMLERLEKVNFDVFEPALQVRDWRMPWRLWKNYHLRVF